MKSAVRIYLAAMFCHKELIQKYADELTELGFIVTSRWMREKQKATDQITDISDWALNTAIDDLLDIDDCDFLVLFTTQLSDLKLNPVLLARGGRHFETGYAYAQGKKILIVGPRENIFHYLSLPQVDSWKKAKEYLTKCVL